MGAIIAVMPITNCNGESENSLAAESLSPPEADAVVSNPIGQWKFDEGRGALAQDSSGFGNSGTLNDNGPAWILGKSGQALSFDGVNDYVGFGDKFDFERTDPFTFTFWMRPAAYGRFVIAKQDNYNVGEGYRMFLQSDGRLNFALCNNQSNRIVAQGSTTLTLSNWYFVAITYDGSSQASGIKMYVNAAPEAMTVVANSLTASTVTSEAFRIGCREGCTYSRYQGAFDELLIFGAALGQEEIQALFDGYNPPPGKTGELSPFIATGQENRVDLDNDGSLDSYWSVGTGATSLSCEISLFNITANSLRWRTTVSDCESCAAPVFHARSFMGDSMRDFTVVVKGTTTASNPFGYYLRAGDGSNGLLRNFSFVMGNASRQGVIRRRGIAVVDFQLQNYPGAALLARNTGGGGDTRGHLFYFPLSSNAYIDLTREPDAINAALFRNYPFPGIDVPGTDPTYKDVYSAIYNSFNSNLFCEKIQEEAGAGYNCGYPDDYPTGQATGNGYFLNQVAVGDIDADGVDDALMVYLWRSVVYPGRPKGKAANLGAPQYDHYYNPQNDGSACHYGRHYGLTVLTQIDEDPFLETVNLGGIPVDFFSDVYQNVSRNVAVIDTARHSSLPTKVRYRLWNRPYNTTIPSCNMNRMYSNAIHYPADGLLRNSGKALYIHFNRWRQDSPDTICAHKDFACHLKILATQTGFWKWEVLDIKKGATVKNIPNMYVWDTIPDPSGNVWLLYSSSANIWNLGTTAIDSEIPRYRDDLKIALLDISTLTLTKDQVIAIPAKPFLKKGDWQSYDGTIASNKESHRLFTKPVDGNTLPGFILRTPSGYSLFTYDGSRWVEAVRYDSSGVAL